MVIIFLLWILVLSKFSIFEKLNTIYETLTNNKNEEPAENGKKNGLFYWISINLLNNQNK